VEIQVGYGTARGKSKCETPAEEAESHGCEYDGQNNHEFSYAIQSAGVKILRALLWLGLVYLGAIWQEKQILPFAQDDKSTVQKILPV
jgi:hypothetical protein